MKAGILQEVSFLTAKSSWRLAKISCRLTRGAEACSNPDKVGGCGIIWSKLDADMTM